MKGMVRLALAALGGVMVLIGLMAGASTGSAAAPVVAGTPTATITATLAYTVTVVRNANLRAGPGTSYAVAGSAKAGASLVVTGTNPAGDWLQLRDGMWVAAFLVKAPATTPITATVTSVAVKTPAPTATTIPVTPAPATATSAPTSAPPTATAVTSAGDGEAFTCADGCAEPPPGSNCVIKGNVNSKQERIYHSPGGRFYDKTDIKPEEGDRWFCTAAEAEAAGFRASQR